MRKSEAFNGVLSGATVHLCKATLLHNTHVVLQAGSHMTCQEWEWHQLRWQNRWKHKLLRAWAASCLQQHEQTIYTSRSKHPDKPVHVLSHCTHHGGGNTDVEVVHASWRVVVVQVVMNVLMGALPATMWFPSTSKSKQTRTACFRDANDHTRQVSNCYI